VKGHWRFRYQIRRGDRWIIEKKTATWTRTLADREAEDAPPPEKAGVTAAPSPPDSASWKDLVGLLAATGIGGALYLAARWLFAIPQRYALLSPWRQVLAVVLVGAVMLALSALFNLRVLNRLSRTLAFNNLIVSFMAVWFLAYPVVAWADVTLDRTPPREIGAGSREPVYRPIGRGSPVLEFVGIRISSVDEEIGDRLIPANALETSDGKSWPWPYTYLHITLHQGWLGIRWIDHVTWDNGLGGVK